MSVIKSKMATGRHAAKRAAKNLDNSNISTNTKPVQSKIPKLKNVNNTAEQSDNEEEVNSPALILSFVFEIIV